MIRTKLWGLGTGLGSILLVVVATTFRCYDNFFGVEGLRPFVSGLLLLLATVCCLVFLYRLFNNRTLGNLPRLVVSIFFGFVIGLLTVILAGPLLPTSSLPNSVPFLIFCAVSALMYIVGLKQRIGRFMAAALAVVGASALGFGLFMVWFGYNFRFLAF